MFLFRSRVKRPALVAFHREIGAHARSAGISHLHAAGPLMREAVTAFGAGATHYESVEALGAAVAGAAGAQVTILVKGSRFMRMERVSDAIAGRGAGHAV